MKGLITQVSKNTAKTGSFYATVSLLTITDGSPVKERINIWSYDDTNPYSEGTIMNIIGTIKVDGEFKSIHSKYVLIESVTAHPEFSQFIHQLPTRGDWDELIDNLIKKCKSDKFKQFIKIEGGKLFDLYSLHPAAKSIHHAWKGGLMEHTYQMLRIANHLIFDKEIFDCIPEVIITGILFHDYGKHLEYKEGTLTEDFFSYGDTFICPPSI